MNAQSHANRHERLMAEAIAEASKAAGRTRPNPLVGCVIVRDGQIVARGHHACAGQAHGEVAALAALEAAGGSPEGCELYVNLEPCCHHGRTPPCTEAIIKAGIDRVYVGTLDPFPEVAGRGIAALKAAGVDVVSGVLEAESRQVNRAYFKRTTTGLPWVSVKYAMTLDGKIATSTGDSAWISSSAARERVHRLRDTHDAIMVGTGTLRSDNPRLTCRLDGGRDPVRVVLDAGLSASLDATVYNPDPTGAKTLAVIGPDVSEERANILSARGVELCRVAVDADGRLDLEELLRNLSERELLSVLVEGGSQLLGSLFDHQLVDEVYAFVSPKIIGGQVAPTAVAGRGVTEMADALELDLIDLEIIDGREALFRGAVPHSHRAFVEAPPEEAADSVAQEA